MFKYLRITSAVLAAACAAAAIFVFVFAPHIGWGFLCVAAAAAFFGLTLLFKRKQEEKELRENPPPPAGDFITGRVPAKDSGEESARQNGGSDAHI